MLTLYSRLTHLANGKCRDAPDGEALAKLWHNSSTLGGSLQRAPGIEAPNPCPCSSVLNWITDLTAFRKLTTISDHCATYTSSLFLHPLSPVPGMAAFEEKDVPKDHFEDLNNEEAELADIHPALDRQLTRKFDFHIVPWLFGLWLFAFIDRSNIGNANIDGLPNDLHLKGNDFNIALTVFYVPYILIDVPSNWLLKVRLYYIYICHSFFGIFFDVNSMLVRASTYLAS